MTLGLLQGMLGQASALRRTQEKLAALSGENFNVFRILKLETREVRMHSAFLGELLNPVGSHGLKDTFLRLFTELIGFSEFQTATARLVVEYDIGRITADYLQGGRIDIYLESQGRYIFIENKIYANDQLNQLERYHAYRKDARLLYLTLAGEPPTKWGAGSLTATQYDCIAYQDHIMRWLEQCRQAATAHPLVRETIAQYQHLINYLVGRTPDDFIRMEMQDLVRQNADNFLSAHALKQAFDQTWAAFEQELIREFEAAWYARFTENLSPLPEFEIRFQLHRNSYGFRALRNGVEVAASQEAALQPLVALALNIPKLRHDANWLAWRWMESRYFDNLPLAEFYKVATEQEARLALFEGIMQEGAHYVAQFKEQVAKHFLD
jgi:hypothetical protein